MPNRLTPAEAADDARKCYDLAIAKLRELNIRRHNILPRPDDPEERRWAAEGPLPSATKGVK